MADDRSQSGRRSWRGKPEPDRRERQRSTEKSSYKWANRAKRPAAEGGGPGSRSVRLLAGLVSFAACLGVVVWLIWMINPPQPAAVVLLGADYATNLAVPHNVPGYRGLKEIGDLSRAPQPYRVFNPAQLQLLSNPGGRTVLETVDDWKATITALKKGFGADTLILVLALHGGSDADGAYLMPNRIKEPKDGLRMTDVIAAMKELPPGKAKILVVEGGQVESDWRLGIIHNDFARLKKLEPAIREVPNLWVLSGCDVDQQCWSSDGLGQTVFLHYFTEALRGADGAAGSDGRLTLDELYQSVRANVRRWAWSAREAVQEPVLLPSPASGAGKSAGAAAGPARLDPASIHLATVETATPAPAPTPADRAGLARAWQTYRRLDGQVPHPSVYSPMRWRAYGASLVRYDQLVLAGAADAADLVDKDLSELALAIGKDRVLGGLSASAGVSLVMDALNGGGAGAAALPREFDKIAQDPDDLAAQKTWDALRAGETDGDGSDGRGPVRPLRTRLAEYLLRRAQGNGVEDLKRAAARIALTGLPGEPLPAESHYLTMLAGRLSPPLEERLPAFFRLATRSLGVRILADRAAMGVAQQPRGYFYSEQVLAWTRPIVERADARRRDGEDRLFANDPAPWDQAGLDLAAADGGYAEALRQAGTVQSALAVRDRAFAILPDYSRWVVRRHPVDPGDDLTATALALWTRAHELSAMLERPGDTTKMPRVVKELGDGLDRLVQRLEQETDALARDRQRQDWEAESAAAAVPFPDDEKLARRTAIWDRLERIGLHDVEVARSKAPAKAPGSADAQRAAEPARRAAMRGTLATAALGATLFGDPGFDDPDKSDYNKTLERVRGLTSAESWHDDAARLGDRIGLRFRKLPGRIDAKVDEGRGLNELSTRLAAADGLARLVDRGEDPPAASDVEPSSRYRRLRAHDLLVWMADRAWLDHWYNKDPAAAPPYYAAIVARLFNDAQALFPDFRDDDRKQRAQREAPNSLAIQNRPERLVVTSELDVSAGYQVVDATGPRMVKVPAGIPVVRPSVSGPLKLADPAAGYREATRGAPPAVFRLTVPDVVTAESRGDGFPQLLADAAGRPAALKIDGFFRGQVFSRPTEVVLQVVPDAVAIGPAPADPPLASVAMRTSDAIFRQFGEGTGAIAVVLDCSGSMLGGGKWPNARAALRQVLKESVPPRTRLSLWTFSQLAPGIQVDGNGQVRGDNPPDLLERFYADRKDPEKTIKPQVPMAPWDPAEVDRVGGLLDQLHPYYETPLVAAMWKAANTDLASAQGLKNLLVLTDGKDSWFDKSESLNPGNTLTIPAFLADRFRKLGIRITVVFFRAADLNAAERAIEDAEAKVARANFQPLLALEPPGQFIEAKNLDQLIESLRAGLEQKLVCRILDADKAPVGELDVTTPGAVLRWWADGLAPGTYTLRVLAGRPFDQNIDVKKGDRLIVELIEDGGGGIAFRRAIYGDEGEFLAFRVDPRPQSGDWRVSILGDQKIGDKPAGLALMTAIESAATSRSAASALEQARPAWVGFRLTGEGVREPSVLGLRWRERMTYPAPVRQLDVPRWPTDPADPDSLAQPILTAWWLGPGPLPHDAEFALDQPGFRFDVPLANGQSVTVEDFRTEIHYVEIRPGQPPEPRSCLVIRLAYPKDSPYFVNPGSLSAIVTTGYEHRYYRRARKYAGLFWPVNADQFNILRSKGKFRLVSLNRLQTEAEKLKQKVEIRPGRPGENVKLPEPPRAIRQ